MLDGTGCVAAAGAPTGWVGAPAAPPVFVALVVPDVALLPVPVVPAAPVLPAVPPLLPPLLPEVLPEVLPVPLPDVFPLPLATGVAVPLLEELLSATAFVPGASEEALPEDEPPQPARPKAREIERARVVLREMAMKSDMNRMAVPATAGTLEKRRRPDFIIRVEQRQCRLRKPCRESDCSAVRIVA